MRNKRTSMIGELKESFLEDHRHMTQGLSAVRCALEEGDIPAAKAHADVLDRRVGPHIEFEERVFYPELIEKLGPAYIVQLYREHRVGQRALADVLAMDPDQALDDAGREDLIGQIDATLEHAYGCGTLLSHLHGLDVARQEQLADELQKLRDNHQRWTELPERGHRVKH